MQAVKTWSKLVDFSSIQWALGGSLALCSHLLLHHDILLHRQAEYTAIIQGIIRGNAAGAFTAAAAAAAVGTALQAYCRPAARLSDVSIDGTRGDAQHIQHAFKPLQQRRQRK